jgi:hypothetical protein
LSLPSIITALLDELPAYLTEIQQADVTTVARRHAFALVTLEKPISDNILSFYRGSTHQGGIWAWSVAAAFHGSGA